MIRFGTILNIILLLLFISFGYFVFKSFTASNNGRNLNSTPSTSTEDTNSDTNNYANVSTVEYNKIVNINVDQSVTFIDGLDLKLISIDDSRCKPDVQCIWQGELSALFVPSSIDNAAMGQVRIGTVNNKSVTLNGYTFTLKSATPTSASLIVSKQ